MIKLVTFDLDGTLVNAYPAVVSSVNHAIMQLGFPKQDRDAIKRAVGWGDQELLAKFVGKDKAIKALSIYRAHHAKALITQGGVKFLPGAKALLSNLHRRGIKLAIATNRPSRFTHIILRSLGMDYFKVIACADKASHPKPHSAMLEDIMKRTKITRGEILYVGDMTIDAETGANAGVKTICVTTGSSSMKELKALKPYAIISKISELKTIINGINPASR